MVAVPQDLPAPAGAVAPGVVLAAVPRQPSQGIEPSASRRAVAVVVDAMELLRPQSDLVRMLAGFDEVDVLVAAECPAPDLDDGGDDDGDGDDLDDAAPDELGERLAELDLPRLNTSRLGLRTPFAPTAEDDLVAALSELVGFDPEPGVYCLAPADLDPARAVVNRAAQRIAQVYGLPMMRYRSLELSVVGADGGS
jgi:hypothetical protein